ncbi:probable l-isoaspartyl protein carboxyl methyltransferase [Melanopsichium pennsylvanicum]|uniref:protein-L-isoaspartate(D-aspartate) O-methyltransferase n=2 Tax=Melanopsichium pennsylvanicum TaxID=63383 RepID=A0AAJ4XKX7_9BASI|nr:probable l-isoaspartyl protein carboxyl methyltransferase [Melanopsichium pennsylvanicum 4]SNX83856.1 probable l-isoaspartyl protein carboxyl methyltransferase [Melanopsichium pennsylvanicum]
MQNSSLISSIRVSEAMSKVDRANYVPIKKAAYQDSPQPIGYGATISAPHMHASAAENLLPFLHSDAKVLDVGSGSGYLLAIFHHLVNNHSSSCSTSNEVGGGKVVGIDHIRGLVDQANENLESDGLGNELQEGKIVNVYGDGRQGMEKEAPFDAIHVGAAAPGIPQALIHQLKSPGRMFIPVEEQSGEQNIWQVDKAEDGKVQKSKICGVLYVPLTDAQKQWSDY